MCGRIIAAASLIAAAGAIAGCATTGRVTVPQRVWERGEYAPGRFRSVQDTTSHDRLCYLETAEAIDVAPAAARDSALLIRSNSPAILGSVLEELQSFFYGPTHGSMQRAVARISFTADGFVAHWEILQHSVDDTFDLAVVRSLEMVRLLHRQDAAFRFGGDSLALVVGFGRTASEDAPLEERHHVCDVRMERWSQGPRYPDRARRAEVSGAVLVAFVVDTTGKPDMRLVRVLGSTDLLFTDAVLSALPRMRFVPAEVDGRKVRRLVEQPFVFTIQP